MSRILIKYASRGRPNMFVKAIQNIRNTILTRGYEILVSADEDDRLMNNPQMRKYLGQTKNIKIVYGTSTSKVHAINRDMEHAAPWDILINMSDDMVFKSRGWDRKIIVHSRQVWGMSLDWFGHWSDGFVHASLPTMSIMGREYFERDKYIYHPSYKSFSCDAEAMYVAMARGRYKYFPEVLFHHQHPGNSRRFRSDHLYKSNSRHSEHDIRNYFERLNNDFELDLPGPHPWDQWIIKLRDDITQDEAYTPLYRELARIHLDKPYTKDPDDFMNPEFDWTRVKFSSSQSEKKPYLNKLFAQ